MVSQKEKMLHGHWRECARDGKQKGSKESLRGRSSGGTPTSDRSKGKRAQLRGRKYLSKQKGGERVSKLLEGKEGERWGSVKKPVSGRGASLGNLRPCGKAFSGEGILDEWGEKKLMLGGLKR